MSAARAHAQGELQSRTRANDLEAELEEMTKYAAESNAMSTTQIEELEDECKYTWSKYEKLKTKYRELAAE